VDDLVAGETLMNTDPPKEKEMSSTESNSRLAPWRWPTWAVILVMIAIVGACTLPVLLSDSNNLAAIAAGSGTGSGFAFLFYAFVKSRGGAREGKCEPGTRAGNRFGAAMGAWMAVYILDVVLISWVLNIETWPLWARAVAAVTPALPIGGVIYALMRYLSAEPDEYQRLLMTRAVLIATGLTFFVLTAWGFLELYIAQTPHFPVAFAMTPFWLFFGFANWWVRK
jgi:hypothetical protein